MLPIFLGTRLLFPTSEGDQPAWLAPATVLPCTTSSMEGSGCSASSFSAASVSIGGVSPPLPSMAMSLVCHTFLRNTRTLQDKSSQ